MIENLETLVTLSKTGTMMEAGTVLKISQSAVSKRIATLERYYDRALIERHGRRVLDISRCRARRAASFGACSRFALLPACRERRR